MNAKALFRTLCFLLIVFVVVYVGLENNQVIDFRFSLLLDKPLKASAALLYFGVFAVGVLGGTLLHAGGAAASGGGSPAEPAGKKKK